MQEKNHHVDHPYCIQYKRILRFRVMPEFGEKRLSDIKPLTVHNFARSYLKRV
ncbi:hypothetical protein ACT7C5_28865 [Bacillus pacificus]